MRYSFTLSPRERAGVRGKEVLQSHILSEFNGTIMHYQYRSACPFESKVFAFVAGLIFLFTTTAHAIVGATTRFVSYEGESGLLNGGASIAFLTNAPTTPFSSPELEASGHAYVQLNSTDQSITWTNDTTQNFTAINLRSCIPDALTGGGITSSIDLYVNGVFRQALSVNSMQNYCYEGTNYNGQADKNPADGNPRGFWNDTHAFVVGAPVAPGDTITLQKDAANSATFYYVDVVDMEDPGPPLIQPPHSLSITDYGAVSNNAAVDNTTAINNCFKAAQSQGKIAWIPPGTFYFSAIHGGLQASGIMIQGAGPWYSTLYRVTPGNNSQGVANIITTTSSTLRDLSLDCNGSNRAGNNNNGAVNFSGNNWLVDDVWIQHVTSAFWCAGVGGTAQNCRVLSVWSDGGNFNNVQSANGIGMNLTYSNNFVRGTGDDAMAINSVNYNTFGSTTYYYTTLSNIVYCNNTAIGAWGGKGIGIYGGIDDVVTNNLLRDTARYIGLGVGKFGVNGSALISATVMGNTVLRCGGNGYSQQQPAMMMGNGGDGQSVGTVANAYCASNTIIDPVFSGVGFTTGTNIVFQYNTIINPGQDGITLGGGSLGTGIIGNAIIYSNSVSGLQPGYFALTNRAPNYAGIVPQPAANFLASSGATVEPCAEGGQDLSLAYASWAAYGNINLNNMDTFVARVASPGPNANLEIHLDSPAGALAGMCSIPQTGNGQIYADVYCHLDSSSGVHTLYLVCAGGGGIPVSVQWFGLYSAPPTLSNQLIVGNVYSLKSVINGKYVTAPNGGSNSLIAQSVSVGTAEQFQIVNAGGGNIAFLALANSNYVTAENNGANPLIANRTAVGNWETFTEFDAGNGNIGLRAMNDGKYVTAPNSGANPIIAQSTSLGAAESFVVGLVSGLPPTSPVDVIATAGNSRAFLNWPPSAGASGYNVKRSTVSGGPYALVATNLSSATYTDSAIANGTTYYYVISALNAVGESTNSSQVYAMPGTLSRKTWVASSSTTGSDQPDNALDGDLSTRWSTGTSQANGQWFQIDMGSVNVFNKLVLNSANSPNDYPRGYQVLISNDGVNWTGPVATGTGTAGTTTISFATQAAQYIRIIQTGSVGGTFWSIHEFNAFGAAPFVPTGLTAATVASGQVDLSWTGSAGATGYNLKRSVTSGAGYTTISTNSPTTAYADTGLPNGVTYFYVVSATNAFGESVNSIEASAHPVSTVSLPVSFTVNGDQIQLSWSADHLGWRLEMQTNSLSDTGWITVPNSTATNQISVLIQPNGNAFFRLVYP